MLQYQIIKESLKNYDNKIYQGDKRAVVAVILREMPNYQKNLSETYQSPFTQDDINPDKLPVNIVEDENMLKNYEKMNNKLKNVNSVLHEIIEDHHVNDLEAFFILRAANKNDRWSMQIAYPGGRQEDDETDEETCKREVFEETGIILNDKNFEYLGRLNDRVLDQNGKTLIVASLVYIQREQANHLDVTNHINLESSEIAAAGFVPLQNLISDDYIRPLTFNINGTQFARDHPIVTKIANMYKLEKILFTSIVLNMNPIFSPNKIENVDQLKKKLYLWGLTLGITAELLYDVTNLREYPINNYVNYPIIGRVENMFDNHHNLFIHLLRIFSKHGIGKTLVWREYIILYTLLVFGSTTSLASATGYYLFKSKL